MSVFRLKISKQTIYKEIMVIELDRRHYTVLPKKPGFLDRLRDCARQAGQKIIEALVPAPVMAFG